MLSLVVPEAADVFSGPLFPCGSDISEVSCSYKSKLWEVSKAISPLVLLRKKTKNKKQKNSPLLLHCRAGSTSVGLLFPKRHLILLPTSIAWKQLAVPEIVYGRVFVVGVVLPVCAAVCGCGGKCVSVHLQVHQFVARARRVRGVAATAMGAHQTQD